MDKRIDLAPAPATLFLGALAGELWLQDKGDGTYGLGIGTPAAGITELGLGGSRAATAAGAIPANRLVKGHTDGTFIVGTLASKRIVGVNGASAAAVGTKMSLLTGYQTVVAAEPIIAGDLLKCGDNGRVLQLADADNLDTVIGTGTAGNFGNQTSNEAATIVSDSALDVDVAVTIIGITTGTHTVVVETLATDGTDGTTPVDTTKVNWGVLLAVKTGDHVGTITVKEKSGGATITTLAAGTNSAGVTEVTAASQGAHGLIPYMKAAAASTKEVGIKYEPATGAADAYGAAALNGTTAVALPAAANLVKEIYLGDVATGTVATVYTNATEDDEQCKCGKAAQTIAAGATGVAFIQP
jgi:hypothetical protein